ncbi:hypothetical protein NDU88_003463 [Pleurodeles waltl]|uniref:Uncharacterized protein n=1 Tax=Pleurodeles waltl TaxID=8319 RepID=A0AAV7MTI2_PLEWA|nr:hypothetical protein NDU88_003463 [Pleurodeles waltl]
MWVPGERKRKDGLKGGVEEDAEEANSEENAGRRRERERRPETREQRGSQRSCQSRKSGGNRRPLAARHAPGGTWLTKAQDASYWRCPRGAHSGDDGLPRCQDGENGSTLVNPDIRVPGERKREDGLKGGVEEDVEEENSEENAASLGDEEKENADRRHGNSGVPRGVADQGSQEKKTETRLQPAMPQEGRG